MCSTCTSCTKIISLIECICYIFITFVFKQILLVGVFTLQGTVVKSCYLQYMCIVVHIIDVALYMDMF